MTYEIALTLNELKIMILSLNELSEQLSGRVEDAQMRGNRKETAGYMKMWDHSFDLGKRLEDMHPKTEDGLFIGQESDVQ